MAIVDNLEPMNGLTGEGSQQVTFNSTIIRNIERLRAYGVGSTDLNSATTSSNTSLNQKNNAIFNNIKGFYFRPEQALRNIKTIVTGESGEVFTAISGSTAVTNDTTIGLHFQGLQSKRLRSTTIGTDRGADNDGLSINLTTFQDGTASNLNDMLVFNLRITNNTQITALRIRLYPIVANKLTNYAEVSLNPSTQLVTGWNKIRIPKKSFTYAGTFADGNWSSITGIRIAFDTTTAANFDVHVDYCYLEPSSGFVNRILYTSETTNTDNTNNTILTLQRSLFTDITLTEKTRYLRILNSVAGGYGKDYLIVSNGDNTITVNSSLPSIANNVSWQIVEPIFIEGGGSSHVQILEDTVNMYKIASNNTETDTNSILLLNSFKPTNKEQEFYIKAQFQVRNRQDFNVNSSRQGFVLYYKDSSNYVCAYVHRLPENNNAGTSSVFKIDKIIAGVTTNLVTSSTFTLAGGTGTTNQDEICLLVYIQRNRINLYASQNNTAFSSRPVNNLSLDLKVSTLFYDNTIANPIDGYVKNVGIFSNLDLRLLTLEAWENAIDFSPKITKVLYSTLVAGTSNVDDISIHKCSYSIIKPTTAQTGWVRDNITSRTSGRIVLTSTAGGDTSSWQVEVYN